MRERRRANMQNADAFPGSLTPSTAYRHKQNMLHAQIALNLHNKIPLLKTQLL